MTLTPRPSTCASPTSSIAGASRSASRRPAPARCRCSSTCAGRQRCRAVSPMRAGGCSVFPRRRPATTRNCCGRSTGSTSSSPKCSSRDLDSPPLAWPAVERLYRGRPSDSAPWSILRRECAAGHLPIDLLFPTDAEWMDDGMFSRQAIAEYCDLRETVVDLAELLPGETWEMIVARLHLDHLL